MYRKRVPVCEQTKATLHTMLSIARKFKRVAEIARITEELQRRAAGDNPDPSAMRTRIRQPRGPKVHEQQGHKARGPATPAHTGHEGAASDSYVTTRSIDRDIARLGNGWDRFSSKKRYRYD